MGNSQVPQIAADYSRGGGLWWTPECGIALPHPTVVDIQCGIALPHPTEVDPRCGIALRLSTEVGEVPPGLSATPGQPRNSPSHRKSQALCAIVRLGYGEIPASGVPGPSWGLPGAFLGASLRGFPGSFLAPSYPQISRRTGMLGPTPRSPLPGPALPLPTPLS